MRARLHQFGDGAPVARALDDEIGDQRDGFGMIELDAALEAPARHHRGHGDQQFVFLARRRILDEPRPSLVLAGCCPTPCVREIWQRRRTGGCWSNRPSPDLSP